MSQDTCLSASLSSEAVKSPKSKDQLAEESKGTAHLSVDERENIVVRLRTFANCATTSRR